MGKGDDPNIMQAVDGADMPLGTVEAMTDPVTDPEVIAQLRKAREEGDEQARRILAANWALADEFDLDAAKVTARQLGIDYALAVRLEDRTQFPVETDENGNLVEESLQYQPYKDYLYPHKELVRSAEETMPGAQEAAAELLEHIRAGNKLSIFCDYDPDGTCSGTVFREALLRVGADPDKLHWEYADAAEGFGMTERFVKSASRRGSSMIIVLDCGSAQPELMALAQSKGMKVLIIDHHDANPHNPADHHLNPSFINMQQAGEPYRSVVEARALLERCVKAKQQSVLHPDDEDVAAEMDECTRLAQEMIQRLDELSGSSSKSKMLQTAIDKAAAKAEEGGLPNTNSAAQLNWKFGAELLRQAHGEVPDDWYGRPMYLAGFGARADVMTLDETAMENRAFLRIPLDEEARPSPLLIDYVAEQLGEDPLNPGSLMRTSAVLNLSKRTTRVKAKLVAKGLQSEDPRQVRRVSNELLAQYETSLEARAGMSDLAHKDWERRKAKLGKNQPLVVAALVKGFPEDAGQARPLANEFVKEENVTAIVGAVRPDGLVKFSVSGVNKAEVGQILKNHKLRSKLEQACVVETKGEDGEIKKSISVGGHKKVISGTCTQEKFDEVVAAFEEFGRQVMADDPRKWRKPIYKNPKYFVSDRMVSPDRFARLEEEVKLLRPTGNNNFGLTVSTPIRLKSLGELEERTNRYQGQIELSDGSVREADIEADLVDLLKSGSFFEAALPMDRNRYLVRDIGVIWPKKKS